MTPPLLVRALTVQAFAVFSAPPLPMAIVLGWAPGRNGRRTVSTPFSRPRSPAGRRRCRAASSNGSHRYPPVAPPRERSRFSRPIRLAISTGCAARRSFANRGTGQQPSTHRRRRAMMTIVNSCCISCMSTRVGSCGPPSSSPGSARSCSRRRGVGWRNYRAQTVPRPVWSWSIVWRRTTRSLPGPSRRCASSARSRAPAFGWPRRPCSRSRSADCSTSRVIATMPTSLPS